jgi:hypothetical protein
MPVRLQNLLYAADTTDMETQNHTVINITKVNVIMKALPTVVSLKTKMALLQGVYC